VGKPLGTSEGVLGDSPVAGGSSVWLGAVHIRDLGPFPALCVGHIAPRTPECVYPGPYRHTQRKEGCAQLFHKDLKQSEMVQADMIWPHCPEGHFGLMLLLSPLSGCN
jgi:hypothetical protein